MSTQILPTGYPKVSEIRSRVVAVLAATLGTVTGPDEKPWTESTFLPSDIGRDGGPSAGRRYSVEINSTDIGHATRTRRGSNYGNEPSQATTNLTIRWLVKPPSDGLVSGYARALDVSHRIVGALLAGEMNMDGMHGIEIGQITYSTLGDGAFVLGEISASIGHPFVIEVAA